MAINRSDVSAIIGDSVRGSFWGYTGGVYEGSFTIGMDLEQAGFVKLGFIDSEEGVGFEVTADETDIVAWGKQTLYTDFSAGKEVVTIPSISFFDPDLLSWLKGTLNVTSYTEAGNLVTRVLEVPSRQPEAKTLILLGEGRHGRRVMKVIPEGVPSIAESGNWNDSDLAQRTITVNCNTKIVNGVPVSSILDFDNISTAS